MLRDSSNEPASAGFDADLDDSTGFYDDYFLDYRRLMPTPSRVNVNRPRFAAAPTQSDDGVWLMCRAFDARHVRVVCDLQLVRYAQQETKSGVDSESRRPYAEIRVRIPRFYDFGDSEGVGGSNALHSCYCLASASDFDDGDTLYQRYVLSNDATAAGASEDTANGLVRSRDIIIRDPRLYAAQKRRNLQAMTIASTSRIAEGQTAQLACTSLVPLSTSSKVIWSKDGELISANADSNLILTNDGNLIIAAARFTDSGNYTCTLDSEIDESSTLPSTSSEVIVYVDGEWSPWSEWHGMCPQASQFDTSASLSASAVIECTVLRGQVAMTRGGSADAIQRVLPRQRRTRACNNPAPLNGGRPCEGADEEFRMCRHACQLDGDWSTWTEWAACDETCTRSRTRSCNAPAPINGGADCVGETEEQQDCTLRDNTAVIPRHCRLDRFLAEPKSFKPGTRGNATVYTFDKSNSSSHVNNQNTRRIGNIGENSQFSNKVIYNSHHTYNKLDSLPTGMKGYPPQVYVLASMGCVAFLLFVIALLVAALLCTNAQRRRGNRKSNYTSPNLKKRNLSDAVNPVDYHGITKDGKKSESVMRAPSVTPSFISNLDATGRFLVGDNGEKIYFPVATNEDSQGVCTVLLSEAHQRYLVGTTRASTPSTAATRFFTLASAKSTPAHFIRHTASTTAAATAFATRSRSTRDTNVNGYFLNRHQLAESRVPLIAAEDSSPSNAGGSGAASSSSGGGGGGITPYHRANGTESSPYVSSASESGSLLMRQLAAYSTYYDPRIITAPSNEVYGGSDAENYATLYDYAVSSSLPARPHLYLTQKTQCDDSGNHSSSDVVGNEGIVDSVSISYDSTCDNNHHYYMPSFSQSQSNDHAGEWAKELNDQTAPTIVAAQVDSECARIELRRSGVGLTIGEFAFAEERMVFLAASDCAEDRPRLVEGETWLSSTVSYGPCHQDDDGYLATSPATILNDSAAVNENSLPIPKPDSCTAPSSDMRRPVVLSFEHCASLFPKDNWQFVLYGDISTTRGCLPLSARSSINNSSVNEQSNVVSPKWEVLCVVGEENLNTRVYVHLERQRCHVMTENFGRYLLAGRPRRANVSAQKRVHLAAYCSVAHNEEYNASTVTSIRVYCVPEMQMCVESVRKQEDDESLKGILLAEADNFPMLPHGELCCHLEEIRENYALHSDSSQYLEISDNQHLWCAQNGLHFSLNLRKLCTANTPSNDDNDNKPLISGRIIIFQKGNPSERQILAFKLDHSQSLENCRLRKSTSLSSTLQQDVSCVRNACSTLVSRQFQLNFPLKQRLCELLDNARASNISINSPNSSGSQPAGWIALAQRLNYDRYIQYFGTHPGCSPTSLILDMWEAHVGTSERALLDLMQTLRVLGRSDAAALLEPQVVSNAAQHLTLRQNGPRLTAPLAPPHHNQNMSVIGNSDDIGSPYLPRLPPPPPPNSSINVQSAILNLG